MIGPSYCRRQKADIDPEARYTARKLAMLTLEGIGLEEHHIQKLASYSSGNLLAYA